MPLRRPDNLQEVIEEVAKSAASSMSRGETLDEVTSDAVTRHCPACGHRWSMVMPGQ